MDCIIFALCGLQKYSTLYDFNESYTKDVLIIYTIYTIENINPKNFFKMSRYVSKFKYTWLKGNFLVSILTFAEMENQWIYTIANTKLKAL